MIVETQSTYQKPDITITGGMVIFFGSASLFASIINFLFRIATFESDSKFGIKIGGEFYSFEQISVYVLMIVIAAAIVSGTINNIRLIAENISDKRYGLAATFCALQLVIYGVSMSTSYLGVNMSFEETKIAAIEGSELYKRGANLDDSSSKNAVVVANLNEQYGNGLDPYWKGQSSKLSMTQAGENNNSAIAIQAMTLAYTEGVGTEFGNGKLMGMFGWVLLAIVFLLDACMSAQTYSRTVKEWELNNKKIGRHRTSTRKTKSGIAVRSYTDDIDVPEPKQLTDSNAKYGVDRDDMPTFDLKHHLDESRGNVKRGVSSVTSRIKSSSAKGRKPGLSVVGTTL